MYAFGNSPHPQDEALSLSPVRFALLLAALASPVAASPAEESISYNRDVQAVFSRLGCNGGQCHGAVQGKNGFRLSLFGADPALDFDRLLHADGGRRLNVFDPEQSLLLQKATGQVAHQGGVRTSRGSAEYRILRDWIVAGAKGDDTDASRLVRLKVDPAEKTARIGEPFPLAVTAFFADGSSREVTGLCSFETLDAGIVTVDENGIVTPRGVGDAALIIRYRSDPILARVLTPRVSSDPFPEVRPENFVDRHVLARLRQLNLPPSPLSDDATFLRRVSLDLTGELPSAQDVRRFLADERADKRARKIDELLARPGHAALWTMNFCDILKAAEWGEFGSALSYEKEAARFQAWVRARLDENLPYDQFAARILTATSRDGKSLKEHAEEAVAMLGSAGPGRQDLELYSQRQTPDLYWQRHNSTGVEATLQVAHAFLGLRLECAKCHRHPNDTWQQDDLLSFANFFMGVRSIKQSTETPKLFPELEAARKELEAESKEMQKKVKQFKDDQGKKLEDDAKKAKAELEPLAKALSKAENELIVSIARAKEKKADVQAFAIKTASTRAQIEGLRKTIAPLKETMAANDTFNREMARMSKRAELMGNAGMRILQTDILIVKTPKFANVSSPIGTQTSKDFRLLGEKTTIDVPKDSDPRVLVAEWLRRPDNPYFARALVNRVWAHYFGRGIVDPPDNLSLLSPATHPELLKELSDGFIRSGYNLRWLHRTIVSSRTYQQSSMATKANEMDRANYAYFPYRRLPAEVMIDVLSQATGVPEKLGFSEQQYLRDTMRAVELPYVPGNGFVAFFLDTFGRTKRNGVVQCDCQRDTSATMLQVLSLANHPRVWEKITDPVGLATVLSKRNAKDDENIEELFLTVVSRPPTEGERLACRSYLADAPSPAEGYQGILWSLVNTKEFLLQH